MNIRNIILLGLFIVFIRCSNDSNETESVNIQPINYNVEGERIILRSGPGENFDKIINKKASALLKEDHYTEVDYTVKVIILDSKDGWSKIKVTEPDYLSKSHVGWMPTEHIVKENKPERIGRLESSDYEILRTEKKKLAVNYYVLIKLAEFDKDRVHEFILKFRNQHCTSDCSIFVYDTKSILPLIDKYPLENAEYVTVADHFIAISTFDAPKLKSWYPYQDFLYKEYGGKNWKKEPF